jgi:hypothetical protein
MNLDCPADKGFTRADAIGSKPLLLLFVLLRLPSSESSVGRDAETLPLGEVGR